MTTSFTSKIWPFQSSRLADSLQRFGFNRKSNRKMIEKFICLFMQERRGQAYFWGFCFSIPGAVILRFLFFNSRCCYFGVSVFQFQVLLFQGFCFSIPGAVSLGFLFFNSRCCYFGVSVFQIQGCYFVFFFNSRCC